jgi:hypothetical protein
MTGRNRDCGSTATADIIDGQPRAMRDFAKDATRDADARCAMRDAMRDARARDDARCAMRC